VVPWPAAGVTDIVARVIGEKLQTELGQPVVVENKAGANGFIGTEYVAKAAPDGYTLLLMTTSTHIVAPNLYRKLPYDPIKDFAPISQITAAPTIMVTPPNSPHASLAALIAYAKANPKKLNYATYGAGGSSQLAAP
jgi:tripartite-type tricarboxylate transporter receptor subunit TctC